MFSRYASDADVTRYLGWRRHRTASDTRAYVTFTASEWEESGVGAYLIWSRETGDLLGATGLSATGPRNFMTGYVLAKDAWGRGYATEALHAMVDIAAAMWASRIYALCHAAHHASIRVLERGQFTRAPGWTGQMSFPNIGIDAPQNVVCYERRFVRRG